MSWPPAQDGFVIGLFNFTDSLGGRAIGQADSDRPLLDHEANYDNLMFSETLFWIKTCHYCSNMKFSLHIQVNGYIW